MTTVKRQPKGTNSGGQFAPSMNPEATVDLSESVSSATACRKCGAALHHEDYKGTGMVAGNVRNCYTCPSCQTENQLAVDIDVPKRPGSSGLDRAAIIRRIHEEYDLPEKRANHLLPNTRGADLINNSSFDVHRQSVSPDGSEWRGDLYIDGFAPLEVRQNGEGGPNTYECPHRGDIGWAEIENAVAEMKAGFPGLADLPDDQALDVFISLLQVAKDEQ